MTNEKIIAAQANQAAISGVGALPVMALAEDVIHALVEGDVMLHAEPGAGKSTALPLAILLSNKFSGRIILLEPRRLAALSVATRLASHLGEKPGQRIGLRMRSDTRISAATRLEVVTEGVLTRLLQTDPELQDVSLVIFDEFHERSLQADLGFALCREVQQVLRDDLRMLLMSATLDAEYLLRIVKQLTPFHCAVRQHPVDVIYLGDHKQPVIQRVAHAVQTAVDEQEGDILVFLPGIAEITRVAALLQARIHDPDTAVHILHGSISSDAQQKATQAAVSHKRRIILSTSLAETSITIDGVRVVIDSGLERRGRLDTHTGGQQLETVTASQASATQRAGRAGRTAPGVCYRLWSETGHTRRPLHWQPEILRADLAPLLIEVSLWGTRDLSELPWLEEPPAAGVSRAADLLERLGIRIDEQLTRHGRQVAALPMHPRLGHMLLWANNHGVAEQACYLAVCVEEHNRSAAEVDLAALLSRRVPSSVQRRIAQLRSTLRSTSNESSSHSESPSMSIVLAQAYSDWVARQRPGQPGCYVLACGAEATLDVNDALAHSPWLVIAQLGGSAARPRIFKAMSLDIAELEHFAPELFAQTNSLEWDAREQRVLAEHRLMLGNLIVREQPMQNIDDNERATALLQGIRSLGADCLPWNDVCRDWQARVLRMRDLLTVDSANTEPANSHSVTTNSANANVDSEWPQVSDTHLIAHLEHWLLPYIYGMSSLKALRKLNLKQALDSLLDYEQQKLLATWLPEHYTVPSGSRVRLDYQKPGNPVLSVRLQEMFGCTTNPHVANGRLPLTVELLSPARRPVQVTEDLANFWTNSYPAVKKDLAGRYPKHVWPDDPRSATPTARAKPRKP